MYWPAWMHWVRRPPMQLVELLDLVVAACPGGGIIDLHDYYDRTGCRTDVIGDGLGKYLVSELIATFDDAAADLQQLAMQEIDWHSIGAGEVDLTDLNGEPTC